MAKSPITESHNKVITGILDLENMQMEFDEIGTRTFKELFEKFDGENVKITINLKNEISE